MSYTGPTPGERMKLALAVLQEADQPMKASEIATLIGCGRRQLTGDTAGTLFLLEAQGQVGRTGIKRASKWYAINEGER